MLVASTMYFFLLQSSSILNCYYQLQTKFKYLKTQVLLRFCGNIISENNDSHLITNCITWNISCQLPSMFCAAVHVWFRSHLCSYFDLFEIDTFPCLQGLKYNRFTPLWYSKLVMSALRMYLEALALNHHYHTRKNKQTKQNKSKICKFILCGLLTLWLCWLVDNIKLYFFLFKCMSLPGQKGKYEK